MRALRGGESSFGPARTGSSPTSPPPSGGGDTGPTPFGLLLSGLGACTAMTLRMYAERKGWALTSLEVDVRYDVDDNGQASIDRTITMPADLPQEQRDRLADIAERTPVTLAVRAGTPITTRVETTDPTKPASRTDA